MKHYHIHAYVHNNFISLGSVIKPWLLVGKELGGELKKGKDRNGKTGLNPLKDVRRSEIAS